MLNECWSSYLCSVSKYNNNSAQKFPFIHFRKKNVRNFQESAITDGNFLNSGSSTIVLDVLSSKERVALYVNDVLVEDDEEPRSGRGLHIWILEGTHGGCTAKKVFDTYFPNEDQNAIRFLRSVPKFRIVVVAVKDEASYSFSKAAREFFSKCGSKYSTNLSWRDMWIFVAIKNGSITESLGETFIKSDDLNKWASPATLHLEIEPFHAKPGNNPSWSCENNPSWSCENNPSQKLKKFCSENDFYDELCRCRSPVSINFYPAKLPMPDGKFVRNGKISIPIIIIASDRPFYLNFMLRTMLNTSGINPDLVTVFIDSLAEGPKRICDLYGIRSVSHTPVGHSNSRISQHYKSSISATFTFYPHADYAIILEEDLKISPDFFSFIAQVLPIMEKDQSVYCISAWNDLGYDHTVGDANMLYRVETMPGLGWVISRKLFKEELEKSWPSQYQQFDWDMWMRMPEIRKGRECIVPDISRTAHFGTHGLNINALFQQIYFDRHAFYNGTLLKFDNLHTLTKESYETVIKKMLTSAVPVNHSLSPCHHDFFPNSPGMISSVFIKMVELNDFSTWLQFCKCLKIWDLDQRGMHNGLWRFFARPEQPVIVVGVPASSYSSLIPAGISPIDLTKSSLIVKN